MSDPTSGPLTALTRRDFLKRIAGAMIATAGVVTNGSTMDAPLPVNTTGYGSGRYGTGKYGTTSNRYSIFLPVIRK